MTGKATARSISVVFLLATGVSMPGQESEAMKAVLERLDALEKQNRELRAEVELLRKAIAPAEPEPAPLPEQVQTHASQIEELNQSKVSASERLPISITGTLLMNAHLNGRNNGGQINSPSATLNPAPRTGGITFSQTVIGIRFRSPESLLAAQVSGSLYIDFFDANPRPGNPPRQQSRHLADYPRLRIATVNLDWKNQSLSFGQDKPLISPREPTTLAQVGVSPLTGAGNPWLWQPQIRFEQRVRLGEQNSLALQASIYQTAEDSAFVPAPFLDTLESSRPGWEGRLRFRHEREGIRMELASGFHASTTHVAATSVPSRVYSVDWLLALSERFEFTGFFFAGKNVANLGTNRQGYTIIATRNVNPIRTRGGWAQITYRFTPRLAANIYAGQHDDRNRDLARGNIGKNFVYAGNLMFRIAPNVLVSFESSQARTHYPGFGWRLKNHYDLALAYQF